MTSFSRPAARGRERSSKAVILVSKEMSRDTGPVNGVEYRVNSIQSESGRSGGSRKLVEDSRVIIMVKVLKGTMRYCSSGCRKVLVMSTLTLVKSEVLHQLVICTHDPILFSSSIVTVSDCQEIYSSFESWC